jgi:DNA replication protein DnaC
MKSISDLLNQKGISFQREVIKIENCENCGNKLKSYRLQLIGGSRKGEWTIVTEECSCIFSKLTLNEAKLKKLSYFKELSIINQSLVHATLENYSPNNHSQIHAVKKAIEFIEKITQNQRSRIMYYGNTGLGKSHLAVGISKIVETKLKKTCLFLEIPRLKHMIRSSWSKSSDFTELEITRAIAEVDLLILDDVGAEGVTPWTKELMFSIMNSRLSKHLLVTTNLELFDMYQEYGPKIMDRFIEGMAKQDIIKIEGKHSYRLKEFLNDEW